MLKSKLPSFGSICSQATGMRMVLTCMLASRGMMESAWAAVPDDELPSSPPRIRNGWPLTMSWLAPFCSLTWGNSAARRLAVRMKKAEIKMMAETVNLRRVVFKRGVLPAKAAAHDYTRERIGGWIRICTFKRKANVCFRWWERHSAFRKGTAEGNFRYTTQYLLKMITSCAGFA